MHRLSFGQITNCSENSNGSVPVGQSEFILENWVQVQKHCWPFVTKFIKWTHWWRACFPYLIKKWPTFVEPKLHYCVHENLLWVPLLNQMNPFYMNLISNKSVIILSFQLHLGLPSGLFPSGFPTQNPLCISLLFHVYVLHVQHIISFKV